MKVTREHLIVIHSAVGPLDTPDLRARYVARDIPRGEAVQDIDKRYRWDLFYAASRGTALVPDLYDAGYNDTHLDTALRAVVPALG